jgi:nicotinamide-nucleotide amidase
MTLTAAVLAVGDELLLGDVVNTHAPWLGDQLRSCGVRVVHSAVVGDDLARLVTALRRALEDADVVLVTGGLGPTSDDLTREGLAAAAGVPLIRDETVVRALVERLAAYGVPMPPDVLRQADVPVGADLLDNPEGSAPGLRLAVGERVVYALPGPPHELRAVVAPVLDELRERSGERLVTRTLHCSGAGESTVAERLEAAVQVPDGVALSYLAGGGVVRVRLTGSSEEVLEPLVEAAAGALGELVWGRDTDTLPGVVSDLLEERGCFVAVAESLTGGLVATSFTERSGSSTVFRGGIVPYATDLKEQLVGVPGPLLAAHGAVSAETAAALAAGVRERCGAQYGLATTGVAGPDEQEGKPVGTVFVAVSGPDGGEVQELCLPGSRDRVRRLTVTAALDLLRRHLLRTRGDLPG